MSLFWLVSPIVLGGFFILFGIRNHYISIKRMSTVIEDLETVSMRQLMLYRAVLVIFVFVYGGISSLYLLDLQISSEAILSGLMFFGGLFVMFGTKLQNRCISQLDSVVTQNLRQQEFLHQEKIDLRRANKRLSVAEDITIYALAYQSEERDGETGEHLQRTKEYVRILSTELARESAYKDDLSEQYIENITKSAPLHDIGKVGVPDKILKKPGKFTDDEFVIMKTHTTVGAKILKKAQQGSEETTFLELAEPLVKHHHEKWDGTGYPDGLQQFEIPLAARIMAVADVYDALRAKRCYKPSFSHQKAAEIIINDAGTHFDPEVVKIFQRIQKTFEEIANEYAD